MQEYSLGPNGGMIYCLEYLEENFAWLQESLAKLKTEDGQDAEYIVFDMPGQVELSTNHDSLRNMVRRLEKLGYRVGPDLLCVEFRTNDYPSTQLAAVNLTDAFHVTDASKYVAILLLSLRTMLQLELPHVNVLSKIDLISTYGDLPFNLDFYTEVQDLSYLQYELEKDPRSAKYSELNKAICEIVEDFSLVGFQTLCVEVRHTRNEMYLSLWADLSSTGQDVDGITRQANRPDARLHTPDDAYPRSGIRTRRSYSFTQFKKCT